ncbi:tetratricopeptide repeat protein 23-like [Amphiura filiformis]|uniref:tetratricopeptide repeat protein 23-like n=1 Tax=Amphiura filiformis TaxID=82378 RepID=UPI003B20D64C
MSTESDYSDSEQSDHGSGGKADVGGLGLAIVDIPTGNDSSSPPLSPAKSRQRSDSESDHSFSDEYSGSELSTQRSDRTPSPTRQKKSKVKLKDGTTLDLTPPEDLLPNAEKRARRHIKHEEVSDAIYELTKCTALARLVYGDDNWKLAESHTNLAYAYLTLKNLPVQAQYHADIAKNIMLSGLHTSDSSSSKAELLLMLVKMYYVLGRAFTILKKYPESEQNLMKAEKVSDERKKLGRSEGTEKIDLDIKIAIAMAKLFANQNKQAASQGYYEQAMKKVEKNYGNDSMELIAIYQDMGKLEQSKGKHADHDKATESYLQAYSISLSNYDGQSEEVAEAAHKLALAYSEGVTVEAETAAERYLDESLGIRQVLYGPHHPKTISSQESLCKLMIRTERQEDALSLLKTIIAAKNATYGDLSEEVGESYKLYGSILLAQGEMEKALRYFKKCHTIQSNLFGAGHRKSKATQQTIDMLLQSPILAAKEGQTKAGQLKRRPRFSANVK